MNEDLRLDSRHRRALPDLLQGKLPGQDRPLEAQFPGHPDALRVVDRSLGAQVQGHFRQFLPKQGRQPQVLYDERIRPGRSTFRRLLQGIGKLLLFHQGIEGHIALHALPVSVTQRFFHLSRAEIVGKIPGIEALSAKIDCIGAVFHRRFKMFHAPGRRQEFRLSRIHDCSLPARFLSPLLYKKGTAPGNAFFFLFVY